MNGTPTQAPLAAARRARSATVSAIGPPRLFHDERHTGADEKTKDLRHVAMPAQRDDKFRLRRLDHLPVSR